MDQRKYRKSGDAGSKGVRFQISLLTLFLFKAIRQLKDWRLSTDNKQAGKFDDVVLEWPDGAVLLQAKHRENKKTITFEELLSANTKNDDFSLPKYFISYQEIKCRFKVKSVIVCTNASVHKKAFEFINRRRASPQSVLYYEGDTCLVYTFNDNILPELENKTKVYLQQCRNKNIDESVITDDNLREFLEHLQFYFDYPSGDEIENVNGKLLSSVKDISYICNETSSTDVHSKMMDWFQQREGEYLTEIRAKAMFLEVKRDKYWQKLERYNVILKSNNLNFWNSKRIFHIIADEGHLMQEIKVFQTLQEIKNVLCVCPESSFEELQETLEAFELPRYTFIVIIEPMVMEDLQAKEVTSKLEQILNDFQYKKVVLMTESNSELVKQCQLTFPNHDTIEGSVTWDDLVDETTNMLSMKKIINFQGNIFNLDEFFASDVTENYGAALNSQILEKLVKGEEVTVGRRVQRLDPHIERLYINRTFIRNGKKTQEGNIFEVNEKVILIADSPGMGKSVVLTALAIAIKKKYPHLWVIKITLSDYTKILNEFFKEHRINCNVTELLDPETHSLHHLEKFLFSLNNRVVLMLDGVDEISPNYSELVKNLIIQSKRASNFSKIFVTTRRHMNEQLEDKLEVKSFKLQPFTEQNQVDFLTNYWAHNLKLNYTGKVKCEQYAKALLTKMCFWTNSYSKENHFASIPLQVRMLAEIFQERNRLEDALNWDGCKEYLKVKELTPRLPKNIHFAKLFKMFIDKKRSIFLEKGNSVGNTIADLALNKQFDECLVHHRTLALKLILDEQKRKLFKSYKDHEENIKPDVLDVGIVQKINSEIHFIHRTFAEYFFAECLVKELLCHNQNMEFQKFLIDEVLQKPEYTVICAFFDNSLQEVVDTLPSNIFKAYQYFTIVGSKHPLYLMHDLAESGYVAILSLILKSIDFKPTKGFKEFTFFVETGKYNLLGNIQNLYRRHGYRNALSVLRFCVERGGVNIRDHNGKTPLDRAIDGGHLDMVKFLVAQGSNINCNRPPYQAVDVPIYRAVQRGYFDMVKFLVEQGANIKPNSEWDYRVLYEAVSRHHVSIAEYLLISILEEDNSAAKDSFIPYTAAYLGRLDILNTLLEKGVTVHDRLLNGMTLIFGAAQGGQLDTIRYLMEQGADIHSKDRWGNTALHAVSRDFSLHPIANILIEFGVDIEAKNFLRRTALHNASEEGNTPTVQLLIKGGANVNSVDGVSRTSPRSAFYNSRLMELDTGYTALHLAAEKGHVEIVKCLMKFGADVTIRTNNDETALHLAVHSSQLEVVKVLVENNVDVNATDHEGCTALHLAISWCQFHIAKYLLEFGVDVNIKNREGFSVLHSAVMFDQANTIKLLIKCGMDVDVTDANGRTALHLAVARANLDVVRLLVDSGVNLDARNKDGFTALHFAVDIHGFGSYKQLKEFEEGIVTVYTNYLRCIKLLIQRGTDITIEDCEGGTVAALISKEASQIFIKYLGLKLAEEKKKRWYW